VFREITETCFVWGFGETVNEVKKAKASKIEKMKHGLLE
jgi:hypothetical protein